MTDEAHSLAVFIDFENLAVGAEKAARKGRGRSKAPTATFDMARVLERLVEKGKIVAKRAYADWNSYQEYVATLHELGIQLAEIPQRGVSGKNSADIRLVVEAMEMAYSKAHIDTFVVVSGDSDFTPLVASLKENGKTVIGLGMKDSTSDLLAVNCDEFIFYEDLGAGQSAPTISERIPKKKKPAYELLFQTIEALQRENVQAMHSSLVKDTMKRIKPSFSESSYGYRSFTQLLEEAQKQKFITLKKDPRSGTYVVEGFSNQK
jgi:uncharacterized protein (TIGR00288 family)